ncbi:methyl-accepting chemotaxis protein [Acetonema longum]|uniref:methyl-accepting chemotaxis protein n=1 Tax=Acetonema longum TaxID=2374 RepID=UPI002379454C|nr:methyl-accepting chemotaxis protein [Acetonema longum]
MSHQALSQSVNETAMSVGADYSHRVQADMDKMVLSLEGIADMPQLQSGNQAQVLNAVVQGHKTLGTATYDNVIYIRRDGFGIRSDGTTGHFNDREYFQKVLEIKESYVSKPLISRATGKVSVLLAAPVTDGGQLTGVLVTTVSLDRLSSLLSNLRFLDTGYGLVADHEGVLLAHPKRPELAGKLNLNQKKINPELNLGDAELDERMINQFAAVVKTGQPASGQYAFLDNVTRQAVYMPIELAGGQRWVMIVSAPEKEATKATDALADTMLILSIVFMIGAALSVIFISRRFAQPIIRLRDEALLLAAGDLRSRDSQIRSRDEIGQLALAFQQMSDKFRNVVVKVQAQADGVAAAAEELTATAEEVNATTDEVARSMAHVTENATQGNAAVVEASQALVHLSSLIQIAKTKAESAVSESRKTLRAATVGQETVRETVTCMGSISEKTEDTAAIISALNQYSSQIASITDTITGIANQTNLLALNAAIEAARAGEAGRGFAVVAEEVRKLAEQSNQGAGEVAALVKKVAESTQEAVEAMHQSNSEIIRGVEVVNKAGSALDEIVTAVNVTVGDIDNVLQVTNEEVASSDKVVDLISRLAGVIETTAAQAEEVAASTEQTSAAMQTVTASTEESSAMATELKTLSAVFKVSDK